MKKPSFFRRLKHLYSSGCLVMGFEHFLVMFPSAMLIAKLVNTRYGSIIRLSEILFACGIGTILFSLITHGKIPFFLGPSFSYIGFVSYQVAHINTPDKIELVRTTLFWGYIFAGVSLLILSFIYRYKPVKQFINTIFPSTIMGPAISLIGLELANMAAQDSGFVNGLPSYRLLAIITVFIIIVISLLKHHFFQNASVLLGVIIGCIIATIMKIASWPQFSPTRMHLTLPSHFYQLRHLNPPQNWITLFIAVLPCTLIAFVESLGRVKVLNGMFQRDKIVIDKRVENNALSKHAFANVVTAITFMLPSALYAENLAIMNLHNTDLSTKSHIEKDDDDFVNNCHSPYSIYPYIIASIISIFVALVPGLQDYFSAIPIPVLGGMELFIFGLISAPGIQMLVDQQVDYKKISNQIVTASVFLAGVSPITFTYGSLTLKGMSLGLATGIVVNLITMFLDYVGYLNERITVLDIFDEAVGQFDGKIKVGIYNNRLERKIDIELKSSDASGYIRDKQIFSVFKTAEEINISSIDNKNKVTIMQNSEQIKFRVNLPKSAKSRITNDYPRLIILEKDKYSTTFIVDEHFSKRILRTIFKAAIQNR